MKWGWGKRGSGWNSATPSSTVSGELRRNDVLFIPSKSARVLSWVDENGLWDIQYTLAPLLCCMLFRGLNLLVDPPLVGILVFPGPNHWCACWSGCTGLGWSMPDVWHFFISSNQLGFILMWCMSTLWKGVDYLLMAKPVSRITTRGSASTVASPLRCGRSTVVSTEGGDLCLT